MIRIPYTEPNTPEFKAWKKRADDERDRLVALAKAGKLDEIQIGDLYKGMKEELFGIFHGKCAYCETLIKGVDQPGDVDHFRPKGQVTDEERKPVEVAVGVPHPGYFWLAYDWRNLLPSCAACNRPNKNNKDKDGKPVGKWDAFPVKDGFWAASPGEEARENPLFINPVWEDPEKHLVLEAKKGLLGSKTLEGEVSIRVLDLNREGLIKLRKETYSAVKALVLDAQSAAAHASPETMEKLDTLTAHLRGELPYTMASRKAMFDYASAQTPIIRLLLTILGKTGMGTGGTEG